MAASRSGGMIAKDGGKRKRLVQPTLDDIFKKQRLGNLKRESSSNMAATEVSVGSTGTTTESEDRQCTSKTQAGSDQVETLEYDMCDLADNMSMSVSDNKPQEPVRLGAPLHSLYRVPDCSRPMPTLSPQPGHTILFRPHVCADKPPRPYPDTYRDIWDRNHVRMPCSKESLYPVKNVEKKLLSRWELIRTSLLRPMASSYDLEEAILAYNAHCAKRWNFRTLHLYLFEKITTEEHREFFNTTLPAIIQLALQLVDICTQAVPLLKKQQEHTITMTQQQVASLLANAFLCTFPRRNCAKYSEHEFGNYPDINFSRLFQGDSQESSKKIEKLRCILHYFKKVTQRPPLGTISFKRQVLQPDEMPKWHSCSSSLCRLHVSSDGTIEDDAPGFLQVDFANEFVGGGVLGEGCVQEEIRFAICPELILSRLFTERLEENECLLITGPERFSDYSGYADTFRWTGNYNDQTSRDNWGRLHTEVVAIDAKSYMRNEQYSPPYLKRDLEKAFCGFLSRGTEPKNLSAVATGKWGCGAFNGDPQLKSLIQIMAASAARRDMIYFTFGDKVHAKELNDIHSLLKERNVTVGNLWQMLNEYKKELSKQSSNSLEVFTYIRKLLMTSNDSQEVGLTTESDSFSDIDRTVSPELFYDSPS